MILRKKPVEVEAVCWDGTNDLEVLAFCPVCQFTFRNGVREIEIMTLEDGIDGRAVHIGSLGDFIIKGVKGEFYACKPDIVALTYDVV
jgi:hypothetical protein